LENEHTQLLFEEKGLLCSFQKEFFERMQNGEKIKLEERNGVKWSDGVKWRENGDEVPES
jgi:hypothetical protein